MREIVINDAEASLRHKLTIHSTQEEVSVCVCIYICIHIVITVSLRFLGRLGHIIGITVDN